ncbi:MAG TPA: hypothetical protein VFK33_13170 [Bacillales bacterium]|nr:hypothetical protein [Bacillales bacterium]
MKKTLKVGFAALVLAFFVGDYLYFSHIGTKSAEANDTYKIKMNHFLTRTQASQHARDQFKQFPESVQTYFMDHTIKWDKFKNDPDVNERIMSALRTATSLDGRDIRILIDYPQAPIQDIVGRP